MVQYQNRATTTLGTCGATRNFGVIRSTCVIGPIGATKTTITCFGFGINKLTIVGK
jgi:hypothetical protein